METSELALGGCRLGPVRMNQSRSALSAALPTEPDCSDRPGELALSLAGPGAWLSPRAAVCVFCSFIYINKFKFTIDTAALTGEVGVSGLPPSWGCVEGRLPRPPL